ncbi:MAG: cysteine desulfurase family protein, partial [Acidobacteriota bacterium]
VVVSAIEHPSVVNSAKALEKLGFEITFIPVDTTGLVDPDEVRKGLREDTALVSIAHAFDTGTIQHLTEIAWVTQEYGIPLHADAVATAGRIPVDVNELGVDLLSLSADQLYGPRGVAALYCRRGMGLWPLLSGEGDERRAGTPNVAGIVGMGEAAEEASEVMVRRIDHCMRLEMQLREELAQALGDVHFNGHPYKKLPGLVNVSIAGVENGPLLDFLNRRGISAASSAWSPDGWAHPFATLRFSMGEENTEEDVRRVVEALREGVSALRGNR